MIPEDIGFPLLEYLALSGWGEVCPEDSYGGLAVVLHSCKRDFVGENAVVFRVRVGDDVQIGEGAVIAGPVASDKKITLKIPDGTLIPAGAVVTTQKDVRALEEG